MTKMRILYAHIFGVMCFLNPLALVLSQREDVECYTEANAVDYRGYKSTTEAGKTCQKWTSQTPQFHTFTPENYPNIGLGDHNYCRNPDNDAGAWCYTTDPDTRFEFCDIGQPKAVCITIDCKRPLGMEDGTIWDDQLSSSSEWDLYSNASNARLNFIPQGVYGAWIAGQANQDQDQWIQVDLLQEHTITGVIIQGRETIGDILCNNTTPDDARCNQWVTKFKVLYRSVGQDFRAVQDDNKSDAEFDGNTDKRTPVKREFPQPVTARYIRINPLVWKGAISLRFELLGCIDIDDCDPNPCQNGGVCQDNINSYTCICAIGFGGQTCSTDMNECASIPCQNGGTCYDNINSYTCICASGFEDEVCGTDIDECASNPCQNEGLCQDNINSYTCNCASGFEDELCSTSTNNSGGVDSKQEQLVKDLLADYDPVTPPNALWSDSLTVYFGITLKKIQRVSEGENSITVLAWVKLKFVDYRLSWEPAKYDDTKTIRIPSQQLWLPDIVLYNGLPESQYSDDKIMAVITNDGQVYFIPPMLVTASCNMDLSFFPYDTQTCQLKFGSWTYDKSVVDLQPAKEGVVLDFYSPNLEWDLTNTTMVLNDMIYSCCPDDIYPDVTVTLELERRDGPYTVKLIIPSVVTAFLILFTFLLPSSSGEKIAFWLILLLTLILLHVYLNISMPSNSESVLSEFLTFALFLDFFATIIAVVCYDIADGLLMSDKLGGPESEKHWKIQKRKLKILRMAEYVFFLVFLLIFIIGTAVILTRRG